MTRPAMTGDAPTRTVIATGTRAGPTRRLALLLLVGGLGGCAALNIGKEPPPKLYQLTPKHTFDDNLPTLRGTMRIEIPSANAGLNSSRIALKPDPTSLDFYAGALWVDVLPLMVQNQLLDSYASLGKLDTLSGDVSGVRSDWAMLVYIRDFQAEYDPANKTKPPTIRVRLETRIITLPARDPVGANVAMATWEAAGNSMPEIVTAFDEAFGKAMRRTVEWSIRTIKEKYRR